MLLGKFDILCCNAPYIPTGELAGLDASVKDYEPVSALDGGEDGLDIIRPVVSLWKNALRENGFMLLEICEGQSQAVQDLMHREGFGTVAALKDAGGTDRIIIGRLDAAGDATES